MTSGFGLTSAIFCIATQPDKEQTWQALTGVSDDNFQAEVLESETARAGRLLGTLVQSLPDHRSRISRSSTPSAMISAS